MADRPILFSGAMVRAILDGKKTQTRRAITTRNAAARLLFFRGWTDIYILNPDNAKWRQAAHGYAVGDRLWVRETWATVNSGCGPGFGYRADGAFHQPEYDGPDYGAGPSFDYEKYPGDYAMWFNDLLAGAPCHRWRSPIHMPRWASRITLIVTDVRVQRVQDISEDDAKAEGVGLYVPGHGYITEDELRCDPGYSNFLAPRMAFQDLWDSLNAKRGYGWDANPWVAAISFRPIFANIDHVEGDHG